MVFNLEVNIDKVFNNVKELRNYIRTDLITNLELIRYCYNLKLSYFYSRETSEKILDTFSCLCA